MAADSSILVLERFREELRAGKGVRTANGDMIAPPGADELYKLYK